MSRRSRSFVSAIMAVLIAGAACSRHAAALPAGSYAGSDGAHRAVTLDVGKDIVVNRLKLKRRPNGDLTATFRPKDKRIAPTDFVYRCQPRLKGEEIRCAVRAISGRQLDRHTIDFMRL